MKPGFNSSQPVFGSHPDADTHVNKSEDSSIVEISRNNSVRHKPQRHDVPEITYTATFVRKSMKPQKLLVIENEPASQDWRLWSFDDIELLIASDRDTMLSQLADHQPAVVILDPGSSTVDADISGRLELLESIMDIVPGTKVIVITANADRKAAATAIALGAYDYCQQPVNRDVLEYIVRRAFDRHALEQEGGCKQAGCARHKHMPHGEIRTGCAEMRHVSETIEKVAPTSATTLLLGESGTGKELLAHALHQHSPRNNAPFVAINCAAIPANLLESELFGHEKGAFTGAASRHIGKLECANRGTLLLDEIGDLSLPLQAKLLRFLQERVIQRIGGHSEIAVDIRIVCATHQNLTELIDRQLFREDLYYRISEITVNVPALRDRPGDACLLARAFLHQASRKNGKSVRDFTDDALSAILAYNWPGNVRELKNRVTRAVIMAEGNQIEAGDLAIPVEQHETPLMNLKQAREASERETLVRALSIADGNMSRVAELLGTSRTTVYELAAKHGLRKQNIAGKSRTA